MPAAPALTAALPVLSTQGKYHAQDELGQYSFGHHEPNQVRSETKDAFGIVRGSYRYHPDPTSTTGPVRLILTVF